MADNELATIEPTAVIIETESNKANDKPWLWKPGHAPVSPGRPKNDIGAQICRMIVEKHGKALENALVAMCKKDYKAIKFVFERAYGKLPQPIEHGGHDGGPIELVFGVEAPPWLKRDGS